MMSKKIRRSVANAMDIDCRSLDLSWDDQRKIKLLNSMLRALGDSLDREAQRLGLPLKIIIGGDGPSGLCRIGPAGRWGIYAKIKYTGDEKEIKEPDGPTDPNT
jgi:hypothetical protein